MRATQHVLYSRVTTKLLKFITAWGCEENTNSNQRTVQPSAFCRVRIDNREEFESPDRSPVSKERRVARSLNTDHRPRCFAAKENNPRQRVFVKSDTTHRVEPARANVIRRLGNSGV